MIKVKAKDIINLINKKVDKHKEIDEQISSQEMLKLYSDLKPENLADITKIKNKLTNQYNQLNSILVNMQMTNGEYVQFVAKINKNLGFSYNNGYYLDDDNMQYYNSSAKMCALDYHQELCFQIKRTINIIEIKDNVLISEDVKLVTAINPVSRNFFMESEVIQKVLAGGVIEESIKFQKIMIIVNLAVGCINTLLLLNVSGLF